MGEVFTGLMQAAGASEKVFEYIDRDPIIKNKSIKDKLVPESDIQNEVIEPVETADHLSGQIEFKHVTFAYPSRPETNVLKVCCSHRRGGGQGGSLLLSPTPLLLSPTPLLLSPTPLLLSPTGKINLPMKIC